VKEDLIILSKYPIVYGKRFRVYKHGGYIFRTKESDAGLQTQNIRIFVNASTESFATMRDMCPREGLVDYYGQVEDIFELDYSGGRKVIIFKCV